MKSQLRKLIVASFVGTAALVAGCKDDDKSTGSATPQGTGSGGAGSAQQTPATQTGEHNRIPMGEKTVGGLKLVATTDGPVKAKGGGEGVFDLVITGGKPKAVRFWVGTEDAKGSVKAKAEEETTDNWHTHVEVPDPIPAGSTFWIEVEPQDGQASKASFDLKA